MRVCVCVLVLTSWGTTGANGAARLARGGYRGESGNINIIRSIFGILIKMELGYFKQAKNATTEPTKIFHYRQAHSENFWNFAKKSRCFDNSSRTRAKARAMARATARRTRARAKDRATARARDGRTDGRLDGRTTGRIYLFSEKRNPVSLYRPTQLRGSTARITL